MRYRRTPAGDANSVNHSSANTRAVVLFCTAVLLSLLIVSPDVLAQAVSTASAEQIQALQKKLDALQSQMAEVQGELRRISGEPAPAPSQTLPEVTDLKAAVQEEQKSNLIWNPFGSLTVGGEFLYGWRDNKDGSTGNAPRIQISAKYNFVRTQLAGQ